MPGVESRFLSMRLSRRRLMTGTAVAAAGTAAIAAGLERYRFTAPLDQWNDWRSSDVPADTFFKEHKQRLSNLRLGCSFSPEEFGITPQSIGIEVAADYENAFRAIDVLVDDLGIKDIRFGIRWANAVKRDPKTGVESFDFSFYKPFVDRFVEKGANVCLNIGPLKTFRSPEEHPPVGELQNASYVSRGQRITPEMKIAKDGVLQLIEQLQYVKDQYPGKITEFQPDNEPEQSTGQYGWLMGENYMTSNINYIHSQFPDASILINASDPDNVDNISTMFKKLIRKDPEMRGKLTLGYDYYYKKPKLSDKPVIGYLDPITRARMKGNESLRRNREDAKKYGYNIEVTEGQAEKWGQYVSPGNNSHEFNFMILRCMNEVLDMGRLSLLRIWGAEGLAMKIISGSLTDDHRQIISLIKKINPQKPKLYVF